MVWMELGQMWYCTGIFENSIKISLFCHSCFVIVTYALIYINVLLHELLVCVGKLCQSVSLPTSP